MSAETQTQPVVAFKDENGIAVVTFVKKKLLADSTIETLHDQLHQLVYEYERRKILVDFANLESLSPAALGELLTLRRKVEGKNGELVLCNISKALRQTFQTTKIDTLFTIVPSKTEGLAAFNY